MKKVLGILSFALVLFGFTACNSAQKSPEAVVGAYLEALQKNDVEKAITYMHFNGEMTQEEHDQIVATFNDKLGMVNNHYQGIASFEIGEVEMAEDGEHAVVNYVLHYGNGSEKKQSDKTIKDNGKWYVDGTK